MNPSAPPLNGHHSPASAALTASAEPVVGKPLPHDSAREHVTGRAAFIDDLPMLRNELVLGFVGSPSAHCRLLGVETAAARAVPGVVGVFTWKDVPGHNLFGPAFADEEVLASEICQYHGQPVVLIAAETPAALAQAKAAVRIVAEKLPPVLTIEDAVAAKRFIGPTRRISRGAPEAALKAAEHVLEGEFRIGGQEHFYLESQAAIAYPGEGGQVTVHSSTQHTTEVQAMVAEVLGVGRHQVVCVCKRMGGGFGGKETQAAHPAVLAALAARLTGRPARIVYDKDTDMAVTGKRHPYLARWRVGFDGRGVISAYSAEFFSDGGFSADLSLAIMERTLLHAENSYWIPNISATGTVCRTNLPSNTAFRGFGGPQGVAAIENVVERIAERLSLDSFDVRRRNLYGVGERNVTPYGQAITHNPLPEILDRLAATGDYRRRRAAVDAHNRRSPGKLRGLAMTPVKFGISFTRKTLNQGNALVNVYVDGTVQVSTGGTEMGQGLNTKIRQLVADAFAIPAASVIVMPTSTEKNANTSPTAASAGTDLNGTAAVRAAEQIKARLAEVAARMFQRPEEGLDYSPANVRFGAAGLTDTRRPGKAIPFVEVVKTAYENRVDLGARGFYATPGVDYNRETGLGTPFLYYTNGAALVETEVDRFTGELAVKRVDMLMDIGRPINPGIDRGQLIGGFVQGMGWATMEELRWSDAGELLSHSPTTYKIPGINDVPSDFRLELLDNPHNTANVAASKAVGEPPLLLGVAAWAAARDAVRYAAPPGVPVELNLPATGERLLAALTASENAAAPSAAVPQHA
jgi:xanthine dehydrogenase large subunit